MLISGKTGIFAAIWYGFGTVEPQVRQWRGAAIVPRLPMLERLRHKESIDDRSNLSTIEGEEVAGTSCEVVIQGLLDKPRMLDFIRYFIACKDEGGGVLAKKIAGYHQMLRKIRLPHTVIITIMRLHLPGLT